MSDVVLGGIYRHFKGKRYQVLCLAKHSETLEELVVYKKLYDDGGVWVRPRPMFTDNVTVDGKTVSRFTLVEHGLQGGD